MRDKSLSIFLALAAIILVAILVMRFMPQGDRWYPLYNEKIKGPYTPYLLDKVLRNYYPNHDYIKVKSSLTNHFEEANPSGNYFFIGQNMYLDSTEMHLLLDFVDRGNQAMVVAESLPYDLLFNIFAGEGYCDLNHYYGELMIHDTTYQVNLLHPNLTLPTDLIVYRRNKTMVVGSPLSYLSGDYLCDGGFHPIGTVNDKVNFAYIPYGKGRFYFHVNPIVFYNYFLRQQAGKDYFDGVMAHLPAGDIYYDVAGRRAIYQEWDHDRSSPQLAQEGPLTYILNKLPLAIAWYILLGMGILFLIFGGKRKQRIIPIPERNENTSLIFIRNISNLFFQQGNHKQLSLQKYKHFLDYIRTKYGVHHRDESEMVEMLAQKSGIDRDLLEEIFTLQKEIEEKPFLGERTMSKFHLTINEFYKLSK